MRRGICLLFVAVALCALPADAGWREDLDAAIVLEPGPEREALVDQVVRAAATWQEVAEHIRAMSFDLPARTGAILDSTLCADGVMRPWVVVVPAGYDPAIPAPLLMYLHGGVGAMQITSEPVRYAEENPFTPGAEERGWIMLFPFGQAGATWWDDVGMANIRNLVREVKRRYNIDDDRVYMAGFSDGGSASFAHAMVDPTDYAAFLALNGHMGVASLDNDVPLYAPNMRNRPIYATTTESDGLYPTRKMAPTIDMALRAGADILYKSFEGTHDFDDISSDLPFMFDFLERHPREPSSPEIVWEASGRKFGRCSWFAIDQVGTGMPARWYRDYNAALTDDRITFGFIPDYEYEGEGIAVGRVIEKSAAEKMGLLAGDIIERGGNMRISTMDDLDDYKSTLRRGGPFGLTVKRGEEYVVLKGQLPEPENYLAFKRDKPSARADVSFAANRINIRASRLRAFRVLVHPDMVNLNESLTIRLNGKIVHEGRMEPDLRFMLDNFLENRDRSLLYIGEIAVSAPEEAAGKAR
jgi:hypothetical protein